MIFVKIKGVLILIIVLIINFHTASAQCNDYYQLKAEFSDYGWTVYSDRYVDLAEGQKSSPYKLYFSSSYEYVISTFSCDGSVTDTDLYVYTSSGDIFSKVTDTESFAFLSFSPMTSKYLKISTKNYASNSTRKSRIRIIIFKR